LCPYGAEVAEKTFVGQCCCFYRNARGDKHPEKVLVLLLIAVLVSELFYL